jgi:hypothetical protein
MPCWRMQRQLTVRRWRRSQQSWSARCREKPNEPCLYAASPCGTGRAAKLDETLHAIGAARGPIKGIEGQEDIPAELARETILAAMGHGAASVTVA